MTAGTSPFGRRPRPARQPATARPVAVPGGDAAASPGSRGFTLVEVCITMVIICLLVVLSVPIFRKAVEQARVDLVSVNLRTIWSAQRIYWLEHRCFAPQLSDLRAMDLIDLSVAESGTDPQAPYAYQISGAGVSFFVATATRKGSIVWSGQIQIDQDGRIVGSIGGSQGEVLTPPLP